MALTGGRGPAAGIRTAGPAAGDAVDEFARAVAAGLAETPRWLPCRYLYDARGSALFERITEQPEYYLTRTEASILERRAGEIRAATGPAALIELGAGTSVKTDHLLEEYGRAYEEVLYVPVDVSRAALDLARRNIRERHPAVDVSGILGQYDAAFPLFADHSPCLVLFLGSTIGNFNRAESAAFWESVAEHLNPGDHFLLGADLVKDVETLEAAYNDAAGVSAEFTKNVFARINRELGADIDLDVIEHLAIWDAERRRMEIFGRFLEAQDVRVEPLDLTFHIPAGERVMTEISRKFLLENLTERLAGHGFRVERVFTDPEDLFAVLLLRRTES